MGNRLRSRSRYWGGAAPLPMDALTALGMAPLAFGSLFLGRTAWGNQGVVRGRRSTDQAERDFLAVATINGYRVVDGADLVAWSQGGDVLVTTLYEQMGSGLHAIQTTAALQPYLVTAGVLETMAGAPAIRFDPALNHRLVAQITAPSGACTIALTAKLASNGDASRAMFGSALGTNGPTNIRETGAAYMGNSFLASATSLTDRIWLASVDGNGSANIRARTNGQNYGPTATVRGVPGAGLILGARSNVSGVTSAGSGGEWCLIDGAPDLAVVGPIIANLRGLVG